MTSLVLIGSGCLVCMMPLAIYLLFLAFLNQRQRPTLMSGAWDFACVLLGLSGFLLVGGPGLVALLDSTWRDHLFSGNFEQMAKAWNANSNIWSTLAASYFILLIAVIVLLLMLRRRVTVLYNIDTNALESAIVVALDGLGIAWRRVGGGFQIGGRSPKKRAILDDDDVSTEPAASAAKPAPIEFAGQTAFLRIDAFPAFHHVTLRWRDYNPLLRNEIETELEKTCQQLESPPNAVGGWLMTAAVSLFFIMLVWMGFIIYWIIRQPKAI